MNKVRLPEKLSDLLEVSIADCEKILCTKMNEYRFRCDHWHSYDRASNRCVICDSGAVMAMTLGVDPQKGIELIADFRADTYNRRRLSALDALRGGDVYLAVKRVIENCSPKYRKTLRKWLLSRDYPLDGIRDQDSEDWKFKEERDLWLAIDQSKGYVDNTGKRAHMKHMRSLLVWLKKEGL